MGLLLRRRGLLGAALLCALGAAVFAPALSGPFVFDDAHAIVNNESLRGLWPPGWLAQPRDLPTSGRPVVALSFALDLARAGLEPGAFRALNIALHATCALLVGALARRTFRSPRLEARFGERADGLGLASALLFLVHPLNAEAACYATARTESLMALFFLGTWLAALRAREAARPAGWVGAALLLCALGMASKEVMVSAPLVIALHERIFFGRPQPQRTRSRLFLYAGLASTWVVLGALAFARPRGDSAGFSLWISPWTYLLNQCRVLPEYLRLVFWPTPLRLDWGLPEPLALGDVWPGALLVVALLALSLYALRRWPAAAFVGVVAFALLAPSSSFVPVASEVGADRRMYLPLALLIPLVLALGSSALARAGWLRVGPGAVALVALGFAGLSAARAAAFADPIALWQSAAEAVPGNARAHYNLAGWLERAGRADEAAAAKARALAGELEFYARILPLQPDRAQALGDLGALALAAGDLARAEPHLAELVALAPGDAVARRRLELVRARLAAQKRAAPE